MTALLLGWLAGHWLWVAAALVALAAWANPVLVWKLKAWILLAVVLWWGWTGHAAHDALQAQIEAREAKAAVAVANANTRASEAARSEEQTRIRVISMLDAAYQRGLRDAKAKGDAVAAGLLAGELRFKRLWQECSTDAGGAGEVAPDPGGAAGASAGRADSAARIVRAVESDKQQIRCLQALAMSDRGQDPGDLSNGCPAVTP